MIFVEENEQIALVAKSNEKSWFRRGSEYYPKHLGLALKVDERDQLDHSEFHVWQDPGSDVVDYFYRAAGVKWGFGTRLQPSFISICSSDNFRNQKNNDQILFQQDLETLVFWDLDKCKVIQKVKLAPFNLFTLHQDPPYIVTLHHHTRFIKIYSWKMTSWWHQTYKAELLFEWIF